MSFSLRQVISAFDSIYQFNENRLKRIKNQLKSHQSISQDDENFFDLYPHNLLQDVKLIEKLKLSNSLENIESELTLDERRSLAKLLYHSNSNPNPNPNSNSTSSNSNDSLKSNSINTLSSSSSSSNELNNNNTNNNHFLNNNQNSIHNLTLNLNLNNSTPTNHNLINPLSNNHNNLITSTSSSSSSSSSSTTNSNSIKTPTTTINPSSINNHHNETFNFKQSDEPELSRSIDDSLNLPNKRRRTSDQSSNHHQERPQTASFSNHLNHPHHQLNHQHPSNPLNHQSIRSHHHPQLSNSFNHQVTLNPNHQQIHNLASIQFDLPIIKQINSITPSHDLSNSNQDFHQNNRHDSDRNSVSTTSTPSTTPNTTHSKKREVATLAQKIEILTWYQAHGENQTQTAKHFDEIYPELKLSQPLISSWLKNSQSLHHQYYNSNAPPTTNRKRQQKTKHVQVTEALEKWCQQAVMANIDLNGDVIREKWREFATFFQIPQSNWLKLSEGWLSSFKERNGLKGFKRHSHAAHARNALLANRNSNLHSNLKPSSSSSSNPSSINPPTNNLQNKQSIQSSSNRSLISNLAVSQVGNQLTGSIRHHPNQLNIDNNNLRSSSMINKNSQSNPNLSTNSILQSQPQSSHLNGPNTSNNNPQPPTSANSSTSTSTHPPPQSCLTPTAVNDSPITRPSTQNGLISHSHSFSHSNSNPNQSSPQSSSHPHHSHHPHPHHMLEGLVHLSHFTT